MPPFMSGKRSMLIVIGTAGALSVSTAVSLTAATWPGGSAAKATVATRSAAAAHSATASLATVTRQDSSTGSLAFQRFRAGQGEREYQIQLSDARAAAAKQAAARAAAKRAAEAAALRRAAVQRAAARAQRSGAQQAAASGSPQQIAASMLASYGWSASQFSCLNPLWERESGWSVTAQNPGSGAYGIAQALPASQMASAGPDWQTSAATQIKWGLGYIQARYGSPCGAWAHEEADGWY
ncbi:MAG: lytic transglycosylase domain-containing protein [Streptosporangiaceae bacterium]|nr:lytic transglycosylase domain-containing protein [Streptosporangiaceae bacterium]